MLFMGRTTETARATPVIDQYDPVQELHNVDFSKWGFHRHRQQMQHSNLESQHEGLRHSLTLRAMYLMQGQSHRLRKGSDPRS